MSSKGRKRTVDDILIVALASGHTMTKAAEQAKVCERTVYRRMKDPTFRLEVSKARAEILNGVSAQLIHASVEAATTLQDLLTDENAFARLGAARSILEFGTKIRESADLEARIVAIEEMLDKEANKHGT